MNFILMRDIRGSRVWYVGCLVKWYGIIDENNFLNSKIETIMQTIKWTKEVCGH